MRYKLFQAASNVTVIYDTETTPFEELKNTMESAMEQFTARGVEDPELTLQLKNFLYEEGFNATISTTERAGRNSSPYREETGMILDVSKITKE